MKVALTLVSTLVLVSIFTMAIAKDRLTLSGSLVVRGHIYVVDQESTEKVDRSSELLTGSAERQKKLEVTEVKEMNEVKSKPLQITND